MAIRLARDLSFSPMPACPVCGRDVLPLDAIEPFAVDDAGHILCREDARRVEPGYAAAVAAFKVERHRRRMAALDRLEADADVRGVDAPG